MRMTHAPETGAILNRLHFLPPVSGILSVSCKSDHWWYIFFDFIAYVAYNHVYFRRQKFSLETYSVRKDGAATGTKNGVDLWRQFLELVSWVLVFLTRIKCFVSYTFHSSWNWQFHNRTKHTDRYVLINATYRWMLGRTFTPLTFCPPFKIVLLGCSYFLACNVGGLVCLC